MICDLIFKIGDEEIPLTIESESPTYPTSDEILNALKNPINAENRLKLYSYIDQDYEVGKSQLLDLDELFRDSNGQFCTPNGLVGNTTVQYLTQKYPDAGFPEGVNAKVLAVKSLKTGGRTISGRCITSNGEELFIINTEYDVKKLAKFLTVRKALEENPNLYDEQSSNYADLEILRVKFGKKSIQELILDFIENNSAFRTEYFTNSNGETDFAFNFLDKISRQIQQYNQVVQYTDPFINAISKLHKERNENREELKAINYDELFYAIKAFHPDLLNSLNADTIRKFKNRIKESDFRKDLFEEVVENKPLIYTLLTNLIKGEKRYQYEIHSTTANEVRLKWKWETLQSLYGFSYSTIKTFDLIDPDYRGYKIYAFDHNGETIYTYNRNYLTENTIIYKTFATSEEVKDYLDEKIPKEKLKANSFLKFKLRPSVEGVIDPSKYVYKIENSAQVYTVGSIVESLDITIDALTKIKRFNEKQLLDSRESTLQDFYNLVNNWEIADNVKAYILTRINNPEKAVTYIYKINEILSEDRTNEEGLQKIADDIATTSKVAYYINSNNGKNYTLIPTNPNMVEQWKEDKSTPVVQLLNAIQTSLQKRIGVSMNLLTSSQIAEKFPISDFPSINPNTSKAFIFNGEIYVNTTIASGEDLLHEYTHIILGVLKSNPKSRAHYEQLVNHVWNESKQKEQDQARKDYKGISEMDIREELFARKFAEYLLYNRNGDMKKIFQQQEAYIQEGMKTIFDLMGDEPLASTYSRTINSVFSRFSSDIATLLDQGSGLDLETVKDTRKKTSFINQQIRDGKITEIC